MVELFSIYQKFIQYAMPSTDNLLIYSTKSHPNEPEKYKHEILYKSLVRTE